MYIPQHFQQQEPSQLIELMQAYPFAMLVSAKKGQPLVSHLPFVLDLETNRLKGHMAKQNPQWESLEQGDEVLVLFNGPQGYISPAWYQSQDLVPTWNYISVQVTGQLNWITDEDSVIDILQQSTQTYERTQTKNSESWSFHIPSDKKVMLLNMITGFEVSMDQIEGNFKLSQNRNDQDFESVIAALKKVPAPSRCELADWMQRFR